MSSVRIQVPATSANIGPGFDSLGLALDLYNRFDVEEADELKLEGCPEEYANGDNLFIRAYRRGLEALGLPFRAIALRFTADIPIARGLGSSSACIVGGLLAAHAAGQRARAGGDLDTQTLLDLAAALEGHPDNTTPALLGGFSVSVLREGQVSALRTEVDGDLVFNALVPPFQLETVKARRVLPAQVGFGDAVFNTGRAALVAAAFFSRNYGKLAEACRDRLHEPYRAPLIAGFDEVAEAARAAGALAVFLSGAGPTVMAVCRAPNADFVGKMMPTLLDREEGAWRLISLHPDNRGATVLDRD